ncbi:MAG: translation elongation factor Ts, partial [Planctomycetes bacterium]|nr:translation elongation factor Ts [Planctomycetota bacterium]
MAEITAAMVKALRDETAQGMMECKKALIECDGDAEAARILLRKKGLASAEKRSQRDTSEGLIAIKLGDDGKSAAMVEVQCETDFCSRNDVFGAMVNRVVELASDTSEGQVSASDEIVEAVREAVAKIGENMSYARGIKITAPRIGTYLHHNGRVGVIVGVDGEIDDETLSGLCMHVAFADPMGITIDDIPSE